MDDSDATAATPAEAEEGAARRPGYPSLGDCRACSYVAGPQMMRAAEVGQGRSPRGGTHAHAHTRQVTDPITPAIPQHPSHQHIQMQKERISAPNWGFQTNAVVLFMYVCALV